MQAVAITSGHAGTGYTTGDNVNLPCGATLTVTASAGVVTGLVIAINGTSCTTVGAVAATGGTGSGLQVDQTAPLPVAFKGCAATQQGGTAWYGINASTLSTTSLIVTSAASISGATFDVSVSCQ